MPFITNKKNWTLPIIVLIFLLGFFSGPKGKIALALLIISLSFTDAICAQILKPFFERIRPSHLNLEGINVLTSKGGKWSMPSNHAAVDAVGGNILSSILTSMQYNGIITACGNVAGANFTTSVFPFILRKNRLIGIDSATCSTPIREKIWNKFSTFWKLKNLDHLCKVIDLNSLNEEIKKILCGEQVGRIVVQL